MYNNRMANVAFNVGIFRQKKAFLNKYSFRILVPASQ